MENIVQLRLLVYLSRLCSPVQTLWDVLFMMYFNVFHRLDTTNTTNVCMYVCMYVYVCVCVCVCMYVCMCN
jgi:hypothetical protein